MLTRADLQRLSELRLEDALVLFRAGKSSSAYYLAGYSVELALKACISKLFQAHVIPDKGFVSAIYTHSLENLLSIAGLLPQYKADAKANAQFAAYWGVASKWNEESRYQFWDPMAAAALLQAINDPDHGVLQWVKRHW